MTIGLRLAGGFAISVTSSSPKTVSASVRGIGVAVMCSRCGRSPDERLALLDAEAVLLVDDRDREVGEHDPALDQRVRADRDLGLPRLDLGARLRRPGAAR